MGLNIKNAKTVRLAKRLARLTGESISSAVTTALRERLDRMECQRGEGLADRLVAIGKDCAARLKDPYRTLDHGDLLYDESGRPR